MLYRSTQRLRRAGASMKNLAHVPSLSMATDSVPLYIGTEHPRPARLALSSRDGGWIARVRAWEWLSIGQKGESVFKFGPTSTMICAGAESPGKKIGF